MPNARSKRRDSKGKEKLMKAFYSAKSNDEMLKAFTAMEPYFEDKDLVKELMTLANELYDVPEKVLFFGKRALRILIDDENNNTHRFGFSPFASLIGNEIGNHYVSSLFISCDLVLLGKASFELKRYDECLSYLNWANRHLNILNDNVLDKHSSSDVLESLIATHLSLVKVKEVLGRKDEVVVHFRKILEIKEKMVEEVSIELGEANKDVYEAYVEVGNSKEALPFCLKALEIYEKHLGRGSEKVVGITKDLGLIYNASGEFAKALEHNQLSQSVLKNASPVYSDFLKVENGNLLIELGRCEEAVNVLKDLISDAATEGGRASACISLANAFWSLENSADAKKYLKTARNILEKEEMDPFTVASSFNDISNLYAMMDDCETAISMLERALPELPRKLLPKCSERLFSLILRTDKKEKGIRYLEDLVEILKKKFGPVHYQVGYGYKQLGLAYLNQGQDELAVKHLANAKDIMETSLGPHHMESLRTSQFLAVSYWNMRWYSLAIDTLEKLVAGSKGLGPIELKFLDEVANILDQMKKSDAKSPTITFPQFRDGKDLCEMISKCGISDDPN